jgi:hypothetical protein
LIRGLAQVMCGIIGIDWLTAIDAQLQKKHIHHALKWKDLQAAHDCGQIS